MIGTVSYTELEAERDRYKESLENIRKLTWQGRHEDGKIYNLANKVLNPQPQYEEVEVVRFMCTQCSAIKVGMYERCPDCHSLVTQIKLTGTYQRPIKPKVKRREQMGNVLAAKTHFDKGHKLFAEWEE